MNENGQDNSVKSEVTGNIPLVTVLMPVYNGERYLCQAIESILNQTYGNFEFIIINDGSTDSSEKIILSYQDPRIVYVKNETNLGIVKTLNKGISLARGEYIARMDADDISLPQRLEKQVAFMQAHPEVDALFGFVSLIDWQGVPLVIQWEEDRGVYEVQDIKRTLEKRNVLAHPTLMAKQSVLRTFGYDSCAKNAEDYALWLRLVAHGKTIAKLRETLLLYRIHSASITQRNKSLKKVVRAKGCFLIGSLCTLHIKKTHLNVTKSLVSDLFILIKNAVKPILRSALQHTGRVFWFFSKKTIDSEILFLFKSAETGGAERVQLEVLRAAKGYKTVTLLTKKAHNQHFLEEYKRYTTIRDVSFITNTIIGRWLYSGYLKEMVVHSNVKLIFGSLSGLLYDVAMRLPKGHIPVIELFHAADNNIEYYSLDCIENLDERIVINPQSKKILEEIYDRYAIDSSYKNKIQVIPNGVAVPKAYTPKSNGRLECLYVGRDAAVKRVNLIRETAKKLPQVRFIFVGVEPRREDPPNIEAHGVLKDFNELYRQAHCLLLLSEREGFPVAVQEAMAYGVVPICTDVGGISLHLQEGKNGYLIKGRTHNEIVDEAVKVIEHLDTRREVLSRLSRNAYDYARKHFDIETFYAQYNDLFRRYLGEESY